MANPSTVPSTLTLLLPSPPPRRAHLLTNMSSPSELESRRRGDEMRSTNYPQDPRELSMRFVQVPSNGLTPGFSHAVDTFLPCRGAQGLPGIRAFEDCHLRFEEGFVDLASHRTRWPDPAWIEQSGTRAHRAACLRTVSMSCRVSLRVHELYPKLPASS